MSRPLRRDAVRVIQDIVREATGTPLPPEARARVEKVLESLAAGDVAEAAGQGFSPREVTILFADLRGFSAIAAAYPGEVVVKLLNRCFATMVDLVARHYGTVDKFIGDAIMVIFGGDPAAPRDHARRALLCAVEMQVAMNELRALHRAEGVPELYMGIGISTGKVMAGLIGSETYRAYTIIGEEYYAATAYLTREPVLAGSVVGQDRAKMLLLGVILLGIVAATLLILSGNPHAKELVKTIAGFFTEAK